MDWLNHELYIEPIKSFIDPARPVERALITHGHADHARAGHEHVLATRQTIEIMKRRYGETCADDFQAVEFGETLEIGPVKVTFYPAGHVLGSAQILLEYKGERICVTGDYKTVPDASCQNFQPVQCDLLVTEATFGLPVFQHPLPEDEIKKVFNSVEQFPDRCHVIGAYSLGKAQRVIRLLRDGGYDAPIYIHGALQRICDFYQEEGVDLGELLPATGRKKDEFYGQIIVAPPSALKDQWSRRLPDPVICQASGWMTVKQRAKQSLVELPLVISDHADWNELTATIKACGAETIWVTHGREEALCCWAEQHGLSAEPLSLQGREEDGE